MGGIVYLLIKFSLILQSIFMSFFGVLLNIVFDAFIFTLIANDMIMITTLSVERDSIVFSVFCNTNFESTNDCTQ